VTKLPVAVQVDSALSSEVADGLADAGEDVGGTDGDGVVAGDGVGADVQATTRRPRTTVVAIRERELRIPVFLKTACGKETFGRARCCANGSGDPLGDTRSSRA
jgi:hypothetical protein